MFLKKMFQLISQIIGVIPVDGMWKKYREKQFKIGKPVTGYNMANFLEKYAEIGFQYVIKVKDMIEKNRLNKFENSKLETF